MQTLPQTFSRSFVWAHSDTRGDDGWLPKGAPDFDPGYPVHVAHDTLEHISCSEDFKFELMAFGATLFGRGFEGPSEQVESSSSDLGGFLLAEMKKRPTMEEGLTFIEPVAEEWRGKALDDLDGERLIERVLAGAKREINFRLSINLMTTRTERYASVLHEVMERAPALVESCRDWMRMGWRLNVRRWHGDRALANDMFKRVYNISVDGYNERTPVYGEEMTISVDIPSNTINLTRPDMALVSKEPYPKRNLHREKEAA